MPGEKVWGEWFKGEVTLHLRGGDSLTFDGEVRVQEDDDHIIDYGVIADDDILMIPRAKHVIAIECLP